MMAAFTFVFTLLATSVPAQGEKVYRTRKKFLKNTTVTITGTTPACITIETPMPIAVGSKNRKVSYKIKCVPGAAPCSSMLTVTGTGTDGNPLTYNVTYSCGGGKPALLSSGNTCTPCPEPTSPQDWFHRDDDNQCQPGSCLPFWHLSSLTTTFANNNGGAAGGAVYFDLSAGGGDLLIDDFELNFLSAAGTAGSVSVYTIAATHAGNELNMGAWTYHGDAIVAAAAGPGQPTPCDFDGPGLVVPGGQTIGVAMIANGLAHAYTTGTSPFPLTYGECPLTLTAGTASNVPFTGSVFSPRVANVTLHYETSGVCASVETVGTGCVAEYASLYELSTLDVWAASNTMAGIDFISTGGGYIVMPSAGSIQPIGSLDPFAVPVAGVGDDDVIPVGTLGLEFGSNGWLSTGSGNSNLWLPSPALALDQPAAQFSCWSDFQPNAGGAITYEESGSFAALTYDQVLSWGTTDLNTFQFRIDTATGNCSIYFGAMASSAAHPFLLGYSPAGPNVDPGSTAIEAALGASGAIILAGDAPPLTLQANNRPVQGASWDVTTSNISTGALFHIGSIGLTDPGLPLSVVGFPAGCTWHASAEVLVGPSLVTGPSLSWNVLNLPASPSYAGVEIYAQGFTLDLTLLSGSARSSNGVKGTVGSQ